MSAPATASFPVGVVVECDAVMDGSGSFECVVYSPSSPGVWGYATAPSPQEAAALALKDLKKRRRHRLPPLYMRHAG